MNKSKSVIVKILYFFCAIIFGTEISRILYRQQTLELIEKGSDLFELGFVDQNDGIFNFYHVLSSYFSLVIYTLTIILLGLIFETSYRKKLVITLLTTILSSIIILLFSKDFYVFCLDHYFTYQVGLIISFIFATVYIFKRSTPKASIKYFFSALIFFTFFSHGLQPLVMRLKYDYWYFPFGKIELLIFCIYAIATFVLYIIDKKKLS